MINKSKYMHKILSIYKIKYFKLQRLTRLNKNAYRKLYFYFK